MPQSVVLNMQSRSHVAWGGYLGKQYDPFLGNQAKGLFTLPRGLDQDRIHTRHSLTQQFDRLRRDLRSRCRTVPGREPAPPVR